MTTPPLDLPAMHARIERAKERPVPPGLAGILALDALALLARMEELEAERDRWRSRAESVSQARNRLHVENEGSMRRLSASGGRNIDLLARTEAAEAAVARAREAVGFVVVDIKTRQIDWDCELHPTREAAIESLTGPHHMWCRTPEEATDERTYYGDVYEILTVNR